MPKIDSAARKAAAAKKVPRKKILIVDDHPLTREGLRGVINREPDLIVCGEVESARKAMAAIEKSAPDLALVDITLPGKNGLELVKDLKALLPDLAILAISMHDESLYAERMLRAGASGYLTKQQPPGGIAQGHPADSARPYLRKQSNVQNPSATGFRKTQKKPVSHRNPHRPGI